MLKTTRKTDPAVYEIVAAELKRQEGNIEMIASESTAPTEVLELSGSIFTNKTEEGYPGARFQAGSVRLIKLKTWPETAQKPSLAQTMSTFSPTLAPQQTTVFTLPSWHRATEC